MQPKVSFVRQGAVCGKEVNYGKVLGLRMTQLVEYGEDLMLELTIRNLIPIMSIERIFNSNNI